MSEKGERVIFGSNEDERRDELLMQPAPRELIGVLERNIWQFKHLAAPDRETVVRKTRVMVEEKRWVGREGFVVTDEVKVTIAGQAALLIMGLDSDYYFDEVKSIFVFPDAFVNFHLGGPIFGVAEHYGTIILSWAHVLSDEESRAHRNLVIHEFAHYIDNLDGLGGAPPLDSRSAYKNWHEVTEREIRRLLGAVSRGEDTVIDEYGASNPVEFFAVATECFFERGQTLAREHSELYGLLRDFYQQDTAARFPEREFDAGEEVWSDEADPSGFAEGAVHLAQGRYEQAVRCFSQALREDPEDDEALQHRALAYVGLGRGHDALSDAEEAVRVSSDGNLSSLLARGAALFALGELDRAIEDLDVVIRKGKHVRPAAYYWRARALAALERHKDAIRDLGEAIERDESEGRYFYHRALCHEVLGRHEEAEKDTKIALELDPDVRNRN